MLYGVDLESNCMYNQRRVVA